MILFRAPPVEGDRAVWSVFALRRRWDHEIDAVWADLLRAEGAGFANATASSSGVEHWCRIASVAIFKGH